MRHVIFARMLAGLALSTLLIGCSDNKKSEAEGNASHDNPPPDKFEAAAADPAFNADTRFAAGQLAESQGELEKAIIQYREALKLDPNHRNTLFRLGAVYTESKRYPEAIATWQQYVKATKNSPAAYNNLALCYELAGRLKEAEATYKEGIAVQPEDSTCRINYGLMLARQGKLDDAIAQLDTVLTPAEVNYNLGSVFEQQGKKEQAKAYYRRALELNPKLVDARSRLAAMK